MTGYITLERSIFNHPSLNKTNRKFCEITAFIWLLTEASFKDRIFRIYEQEIELKRGQLCCSLTYMAEAWNWETSKVRYFIDKLRQHSTLTSHKPIGTPKHIPNILTICHYDQYQHTPNSTTIDTTNSKKQNKGKNTLKNNISEIDIAGEEWWKSFRFVGNNKGNKPKVLAFHKKNFKDKDLLNKVLDTYNHYADSQKDKGLSSPMVSTWVNGKNWEHYEKSPNKDEFKISTEKTYKDYVWFVQKGMRSTRISDDMVRKMREENLITEEQFKAW